MHAARSGNWSCIELLMPVSDVAAKNADGLSAFHHASNSGDLALVEFLKNAALNSVIRTNKSPSGGGGAPTEPLNSLKLAEQMHGPLSAALGVGRSRFGLVGTEKRLLHVLVIRKQHRDRMRERMWYIQRRAARAAGLPIPRRPKHMHKPKRRTPPQLDREREPPGRRAAGTVLRATESAAGRDGGEEAAK